MTISRTIRSADQAVMSAEPTAVGITSTTSAPTISSRRGDLAARPQQIRRGHAAGLGGAGPGREGRVEHVDVHREEGRALAGGLDGALDRLVDALLADLVHEDRCDPLLGLPGELLLPGPVAAQPDLGVALRIDVALLDQPVHRRPVGDLDAEDLGAGVGVGVEVDQADRARAWPRRRECPARRSRGRRRARSGSRRPSSTSPTVRSIASWLRAGSAGSTGASP